MATHTNLSSLFTDIADSIRSVSGGTASIQADTFPTAIQSLGSGFAKIQTGSYVGTGTYGASNPCSLTFDFAPECISISGWKNSSTQIINVQSFFSYLMQNQAQRITWRYSTNESYITNIVFNSKIITWYADSNLNQFNKSNETYYYFVLKQ